jgi:hypothetical protein
MALPLDDPRWARLLEQRGLGDTLVARLRTKFDTFERLAAAPDRELLEVEGIWWGRGRLVREAVGKARV